MQIRGSKERKVTVLFTVLFLLGGFIHVIVDPWDFTSCIAQIYYSSLVLAWAVTIHDRIVNKDVRRLMLMTAALFMQAMFFQICRYRVFESFLTASRYFWYGYYITVILVPVLFLFVVLHLHLQEDEKPDRRFLLFLPPALILIVLVMTNDLHQLVFRFTAGNNGRYGTYTHGALFYAIYVWMFAVLVLSLYLAIRKCRIPGIEKKLWMPLYFAAYGVLVVLGLFNVPKIAGACVWLLIESLAMSILGMEEACIQLGLIPANSSYRMIVSHADKPFVIFDKDGIPVYGAQSAQKLSDRTGQAEIHTKPIRGGSVSWAVDLTDRMRLNREIEKTTEIIESRNAYLKMQNTLKEEQAGLTARNALYRQIAGIVRPQLDTIEKLLKNADDDRSLAKIAFFNAYIKRRSNMELLKSDLKHFPTEELASAIRESCEYLKLCGVSALLHVTPECELSADRQLILYEAFETAAEDCLDTLRFLLVNITMRGDQPVLRMTMNAPGADPEKMKKQLSARNGLLCFFAEDDEDELTITVTCREGGAEL